MNQAHYNKLRHMYLSANINQSIFKSTSCTIQEGKATIGLDLSKDYYHALGAAHGSIYFKLLDDAAFFAASSLVLDVFILTTSFHINFLRPVSSGQLIAEGTIKFSSEKLVIAESHLFNDAGKEIAFGVGHFTKSKVPLSEDIGYA